MDKASWISKQSHSYSNRTTINMRLPNNMDDYYVFPLLFACTHEDLAIAKLLIDMKANVNQTTCTNVITALHVALQLQIPKI